MELAGVVRREHPRRDLAVPREGVGVELVEGTLGDGVLRRLEVVEVRQQVADRVADLAVALRDPLDHVVGDPHVLAVVDHDGPHPQDLGPVRVDELLRVDVVAEALRDLLPLGVDGEAVGDDRVVGRAAPRRDADQQRRVEPAAVLVGALEVDVGRPGQVLPLAERRRVGGARVEPHVEDVRLLVERGAAALRAGEARGQEVLRLAGVPRVGRLLLEDGSHVAREVGAEEDLAAALAVERRDRHAPQPLARDAPVGAGRDHVVDALLAPARHPARLRDGLDGLLAESRLPGVEGDEPLEGGAEDDRVLAAPAHGVRVGVLAGREQVPALAHELDDLRVRVEDLLPGEVLDLGQEAAALVDGAVDLEAVAEAREVVVPAVAGRGVDDARAGVERDVVGEDARRVPVDPGVAEADLLELLPLHLGERRTERPRGAGRVRLRAPPSLGRLAKARGEEQHLVAALDREEAVVEVGVEGEGEVRGQRPGRRRPDDGEDALAGEGRVLRGERGQLLRGEREAHVDLRRDVVLVVLDLGLGERGAAGDAPVDGLLRLVDEVLLGEVGELPDDRRLVERRHREVRVLPLAEDAEALELRLLDAHELLGVAATGLAEGDRRHLALLRPEVLVDLELDREAVAVPARAVRRVLAGHRPAAHDHVLEDLVEDGPQVDVPVRVGRPVVQHEARLPGARPADLPVEVARLPLLEPARLGLGKVGLHREVGAGKVQRLAEGVGHGTLGARSIKRAK